VHGEICTILYRNRYACTCSLINILVAPRKTTTKTITAIEMNRLLGVVICVLSHVFSTPAALSAFYEGALPPCKGPCGVCTVSPVSQSQLRPHTSAGPCMRSVLVHSGLTSRLRAIITSVVYARCAGCNLTVYWRPSAPFAAAIDEVFELPLAPDIITVGVNFNNKTHRAFAQPLLPHTRRNYTIFDVPPFYDLLGPLAIALFRPLPGIMSVVHELLEKLGPRFTAVHLRHTDRNAVYSLDSDVATWARPFPGKVFAAVDNPLSLESLRRDLGSNRVVAQGHFISSNATLVPTNSTVSRWTSGAASIIDMWVASYSNQFRGFRESTFSHQIEIMRAARRPFNHNAVGTGVDGARFVELGIAAKRESHV
jgi:hypothetical protein